MSRESGYVATIPNRLMLGVVRTVAQESKSFSFQELLEAGPQGLSRRELSKRLKARPSKSQLSLSSLAYGSSLPYPSFIVLSDASINIPDHLYPTELAERFLKPTLPIGDIFRKTHPDISLRPFRSFNALLFNTISLLSAAAAGVEIDPIPNSTLANRMALMHQKGLFTSPTEASLTGEGEILMDEFLTPIMKELREAGIAKMTPDTYKTLQATTQGRRTNTEVPQKPITIASL